MLTLYIVALAIGGTLLIATLVLGHSDADADADGDVDHEVDHDADTGGIGADAVLAWIPVASLRFWTFFLAFAGLTGMALTLVTDTGVVATAVIAGAAGYLAGLGVVMAVRQLRKGEAQSNVVADDYIGATAVVIVAVGPGKTGKVRVEIKGRHVELLAETDEELVFEPRSEAMIYRMSDGGTAVLTRRAALAS